MPNSSSRSFYEDPGDAIDAQQRQRERLRRLLNFGAVICGLVSLLSVFLPWFTVLRFDIVGYLLAFAAPAVNWGLACICVVPLAGIVLSLVSIWPILYPRYEQRRVGILQLIFSLLIIFPPLVAMIAYFVATEFVSRILRYLIDSSALFYPSSGIFLTLMAALVGFAAAWANFRAERKVVTEEG